MGDEGGVRLDRQDGLGGEVAGEDRAHHTGTRAEFEDARTLRDAGEAAGDFVAFVAAFVERSDHRGAEMGCSGHADAMQGGDDLRFGFRIGFRLVWGGGLRRQHGEVGGEFRGKGRRAAKGGGGDRFQRRSCDGFGGRLLLGAFGL